MKTVFAEDINYWKTSQTAPDTWVEKTRRLITEMGGKVLTEVFGSEPATGRAAYMLTFSFEGERYKIIWPVLPSRTKNERAARIQAVTLMYHDVKARILTATVLGVRSAFLTYLLLPDGRTASVASTPDIARQFPALLTPAQKPEDYVDGEFTG